MGLLENETWDDYQGKEVYVASTFMKSGFRGDYRGYNVDTKQVQVHDTKTGDTYDVDESFVYGMWMLEDW
jgi:hypothetical protein